MKCLKENKGKQLWEENKHTDEEKNVKKKKGNLWKKQLNTLNLMRFGGRNVQ